MPRDCRNEREFAINICNADACEQGRRSCPVPDACQVASAEDRSWFWAAWAIAFIGVAGLALIALGAPV